MKSAVLWPPSQPSQRPVQSASHPPNVNIQWRDEELGAQAALSPLEQYEANALTQREESMSLLPRLAEPPVASILLPEAKGSVLLQTDSEVDENPNKTLITLSATGAKGSILPDEIKEQRDKDATYCAKHFPGHVVLSSLGVILTKLGSSALVNKLTELKDVACQNLKSEKLKDEVRTNFALESDTSSKAEERRIEGRYWLSRLADAADANSPRPLAMDYVPTPNGYLPDDKHHGYRKKRKFDAALRPCAAAKSTIFNILVNVEFTRTDAPNIMNNPVVGSTDMVGKYQQAITNADDLLTFQPTRLFVPTLSFHGKGAKTKLFFSILSQDRLELAVVNDCFGFKNLPTVSALLHLFRVASPYHLGYNPAFTYSFITTPRPNFTLGDVVPASVVIPDMKEEVRLGRRLSRLRPTPFGRSTVVYAGVLNGRSVVIKLSFISEGREWRERMIIEALHALSAEHPTGPTYAPKLLGSFAAVGYDRPKSFESLTKSKRKAVDFEDVPALVIRHPEIMVFDSPTDGRKLTELSAAEFLTMAKQLFEAILDAYSRRVLHRDVSINNIRATSQLVLYDWEIGRLIDELPIDPHGTVTGTLDTMSAASLNSEPPLPHDDIESAVYVLLKVLTKNFVPPKDKEEIWEKTLKEYYWDNSNIDALTLKNVRMGLWDSLTRKASLSGITLDILMSAGHKARAKLIFALLSLPLPAERGPVVPWLSAQPPSIDGSDYKAVLSSLKKLVGEAVHAVGSIDANDLIDGWLQGPAGN